MSGTEAVIPSAVKSDAPVVQIVPACCYPTEAFRSDVGFIVIEQDQMATYGETVQILIHPAFLRALIDALTALCDG
jgi:hypothetical protein